jgi:magnesium chelatase family protein
MWIQVPRVAHEELLKKNTEEESTLLALKAKVEEAHRRASDRQGEGKRNAHLAGAELEAYAPLTPSCKSLLALSAEKLMLSPRALHRTIRLARTIADLENAEHISERNISEALSYRPKVEM